MEINIKQLKLAMIRKCMNPRDLSQSVGCSYESIIQILSGRRKPSMKKIGRIAQVLDIDPKEIIE